MKIMSLNKSFVSCVMLGVMVGVLILAMPLARANIITNTYS